VALDHLVLGGNGERYPEIDQAMQEIIGQVVAVDDVDAGTDESASISFSQPPAVLAGPPP
jgi:hypothetical protein